MPVSTDFQRKLDEQVERIPWPVGPFHTIKLSDCDFRDASPYACIDHEDFLETLGFRVIHSPRSARLLHDLGMLG